MIADLRVAFAEILAHWHCELLEFGAEADHVHLLIAIHPAIKISELVNNLKAASSKRMGGQHAARLRRFYSKPGLWHHAYYVGSVGGATPETVRAYVEAQGTNSKPGRRKSKPPLDPPPGEALTRSVTASPSKLAEVGECAG
jgi:putative transposase